MRYADRLKRYCNQAVTLERATGPDEWGASGYEPAVEIKARKEANRKMIRDAEGNMVVSNTCLLYTSYRKNLTGSKRSKQRRGLRFMRRWR